MTALKILQCVDGDTDTSKGGSFTIPQHPENDVIFMLQSVIQDTIEISWEVNSSYQAQFTAWDDGTEAFQLLECQNMVEIAGQWFVIKQLEPDYSGGITTVQVTLSHVSNEISRLRLYDSNTPVDWGNYKHTGASSTSTTVPSSDDNSPDDSNTSDDSSNSDDTGSLTDSTDSTDSSTVVKNVTPQDILDYVFKGNSYGITYEVIGDFAPKDIDSPYASGSWKDIVDRITQNWTDAVIMPDNLDFKVYSHDSFYQDHGNRVDYLHDTSEIQLQYDDTNMLNGARLVGATYEQQTTTDTGLPNGAITGGKGAQAVINDARKYLGVPYVYGGAGGARGGNPFSGMDCSSYVSQVYKDFGINIPAQTVAMESSFHRVSTPQTGDVGFYGSPGASTHICLFLDANTIIFEPQPGEVCKEEPASWYYPSWVARNDQMAAVVGGGASAGDGTDATSTSTTELYYFAPFWFQDDDSVNRWGLFVGDDISSDTIQNKDDMKKYALTQFKLNPDLVITRTAISNAKPIAGDMVRLSIIPANYVTKVGLVGFEWYPYSEATQTTETYNSNAANILDYQNSQNNNAKAIDSAVKKAINRYAIETQSVNNNHEYWSESEANSFEKSNQVKPDDDTGLANIAS